MKIQVKAHLKGSPPELAKNYERYPSLDEFMTMFNHAEGVIVSWAIFDDNGTALVGKSGSEAHAELYKKLEQVEGWKWQWNPLLSKYVELPKFYAGQVVWVEKLGKLAEVPQDFDPVKEPLTCVNTEGVHGETIPYIFFDPDEITPYFNFGDFVKYAGPQTVKGFGHIEYIEPADDGSTVTFGIRNGETVDWVSQHWLSKLNPEMERYFMQKLEKCHKFQKARKVWSKPSQQWPEIEVQAHTEGLILGEKRATLTCMRLSGYTGEMLFCIENYYNKINGIEKPTITGNMSIKT